MSTLRSVVCFHHYNWRSRPSGHTYRSGGAGRLTALGEIIVAALLATWIYKITTTTSSSKVTQTPKKTSGATLIDSYHFRTNWRCDV